MTTHREILKILGEPEKENVRIELKRSASIRNSSGQRKIAVEIVALANRYGGKLLLGINDDGTFEGKDIFNIDKDKGIIENICHMRISPVIQYNTEFLQFDGGDVLVVNVPKRAGIPHAYIVSRKGPEIKNRIYYIRTSHGKRLVSDRQLQWLFSHLDDPTFSFPFRVIINHFKDSLQIPDFQEIQQPDGVSDYTNFVLNIPIIDIGRLAKDPQAIQQFFIEISPYVLISSFSSLFINSWLIEIKRRMGMITAMPLPKRVKSRKIAVSKLPVPPEDSIIGSIPWNFRKVLESSIPPYFRVPAGADVQILYKDGGMKSQFSLKHRDFEIKITFRSSLIYSGLHDAHPQRAVLIDHKPIESQEEALELFQAIEMDCLFTVSFNFPEEDVELFNEYHHFSKTIKDHLKYNWDYDNFLKKLPHHKLYTIDNKLNDILRILGEKQAGPPYPGLLL